MEKFFTAEIVRHLKGAPLSAFVLLSREEKPVSQSHIQSMSGYTDKTVESAMLYLLDLGVVTRVDRYHWQLSGQMRADFEFPFSIRGYKGAPLSILVLLSLVTQPVSQGYLQRMSGFTDMTIQSALLFLLDAGHIARIDRYHWQLSGTASQLHLGASLSDRELPGLVDTAATPNYSVSQGVQSVDSGADKTMTPKISVSQDTSLESTPNNSVSLMPSAGVGPDDQIMTQKYSESSGDTLGELTPNNSESLDAPAEGKPPQDPVIQKNSVSIPPNNLLETEFSGVNSPSSRSTLTNLSDKDKLLLAGLGESEKIRVEANLRECDEWGIKEPARTRISMFSHVDFLTIRYHCSTIDQADRGLSIYRIENGFRIDKKWLKQQDSIKEIKAVISQPRIPIEGEVVIPQDEWLSLLNSVEEQFRHADFSTWLKGGTVLVDKAEGEWTVSVMNSYTGKWVKERALAILEKAAGVRIKVTCNGNLVD